MNINENKKVLLVIGMEHNSESIMKKLHGYKSDNIFILQCYGPTISPFGDLMRGIILAVYQEKVEEIFVSVSKDDQKNTNEILKKIYENKDLQEKMQTLDYLFRNCMPEFPTGSIRDWLEGRETSSESMQNMVNVIRNHPLMPPDVKVTELLIENKNKSKVAVL
jgi:carbonic anhydrase